MAQLKTKKTTASVADFVKSVSDEKRREDAKVLLRVFKGATGMQPKMWGTSIIGYGTYHYKSERSTQEGDWPLTGFSPRKQAMTIYIMPGFKKYAGLMNRLGKYKTSVSCLYVNKLSDIDTEALAELIKRSVADMKKAHGVR